MLDTCTGEPETQGGRLAPAVLIIAVLGLFKRVFKKKVKKKKSEDENDDKRGGLTKKDLEDWSNLQNILKEKEGKAKPQAVEAAPERAGPGGGPSGGPVDYGEAKQGYNYLYEEIRPRNTFVCFFDMLKRGDQGLCITSTYPKKIRDMYSKDFPALEELPIFWLSDWYGASQEFLNIGQEEKTLRPARIDFEIMKEVSNFIKKNRGKGVLLLDGIETLILANGFEKVISFLTTINNMASANMCSIIAPINPGVFKRRDRFILQKIFDDVRTFVDDDISTDDD
jgi:hypothetical protein